MSNYYTCVSCSVGNIAYNNKISVKTLNIRKERQMADGMVIWKINWKYIFCTPFYLGFWLRFSRICFVPVFIICSGFLSSQIEDCLRG